MRQRQSVCSAWNAEFAADDSGGRIDAGRKRPRVESAQARQFKPAAASKPGGGDASLLWSPHLLLQASTPDEATQAVRRLRAAARTRRLGLVVLDSVAALTRGDKTAGPAWRRANALAILSRELLALAAEHNLPVLVTNQATAVVAKEDAGSAAPGGSAALSKAALGLAWCCRPTVRLLLTRADSTGGADAAALAIASELQRAAAAGAEAPDGVGVPWHPSGGVVEVLGVLPAGGVGASDAKQ